MRLFRVAVVFGVLAGGNAGAAPRDDAGGAVVVPIESVTWAPVFPDQPAGPAMAVLWGDPKKGPTGFLVRFPAGAQVPRHVHSSDYRGMLISGEFSHAAGNEASTTLRPGSYWSQKARLPHVNACSAAGPCIVYLTAPNGFDLSFVK